MWRIVLSVRASFFYKSHIFFVKKTTKKLKTIFAVRGLRWMTTIHCHVEKESSEKIIFSAASPVLITRSVFFLEEKLDLSSSWCCRLDLSCQEECLKLISACEKKKKEFLHILKKKTQVIIALVERRIIISLLSLNFIFSRASRFSNGRVRHDGRN